MLNKVQLIGRLGADPEVRYAQGGAAIANVRVATTETWKDKQTREKQERTEWHRVVCFGKLGEIAGEYLKKGALVFFEGSIRTNKYTDKDGVERYSTEIIASEMKMLERRGDNAGSSNGSRAPNRSGSQSAPAGGAGTPKQNDGFEDDDIPF